MQARAIGVAGVVHLHRGVRDLAAVESSTAGACGVVADRQWLLVVGSRRRELVRSLHRTQAVETVELLRRARRRGRHDHICGCQRCGDPDASPSASSHRPSPSGSGGPGCSPPLAASIAAISPSQPENRRSKRPPSSYSRPSIGSVSNLTSSASRLGSGDADITARFAAAGRRYKGGAP